MLEVRLIGKFDIKCDGKPVILSSRAAQSLFAYLILTAGTLHRREKLAGMLWPEENEQKARAYLRNELWRIRKALSQTSDVEYLLADNLTVGFNPSSSYWLDLAGLKKPGDTASAEELIDFLSSYQGELLPGFYEDWATLEREHLQVLFEQKMACLLEILETEKRWNDILKWAERWISFGQESEAAYRALMLAYDALGDHAKVVSTYERCKKALRQLDLEPSEETRALAFKRSSKIKVPIPLTSFIGREQELKEVAELFSKSRLVTLTGSGGVGKTRLAIQVVAEVLDFFPDGVWFLDLAPISDASLVPNTLASLLGLQESRERSITDLLTNYFRSRTALVIFDNCEHVIESCAQLVNSLLTYCENLSILATSRETLRVTGEIPYRVPSLEFPSPELLSTIAQLSVTESVRLFVERATAVLPGFTIDSQNAFPIAQICRRLDGIPLAIELAAARTSMLSSQQILTRLDDRFNLLTGGLRTSLPRHQTLRATIDWSYDLLLQQEQILFGRLSVFAGGWTLESAESVCAGDGIEKYRILDLLTQLLNKSLVVVESTEKQEPRYRMLETIRQYAREELLQAGEKELMHQRHLAYFVDLAERAEPNLRAFDMVIWLDRLETELDNIREALAWASEIDVGAQLRLASVLLWFWHIRGHKIEGVDWLERGLSIETFERGEKSLSLQRALIRGKALYVAGFLRLMFMETDRGAVLSEESLTIFRALGPIGKRGMANALWNLSAVADRQLNFRRKKVFLEESLILFQEVDDRFGMAQCIDGLALCALDENDYEQARTLLEKHLAFRQEMGDKDGIALALLNLGHFDSQQGNYKQATIHYEESLALFRELENKWAMSLVLLSLGHVTQAQGIYRQATKILEEVLALGKDLGDKFDFASALNKMGSVARSQGNYQQATQLHEEALSLFREIDNKFAVASALRNLALTAAAQTDYKMAVKKFEETLAISQESGDKFEIAFAIYGIGKLTQAQGDLVLARELNLKAMLIFQQMDNPADVAQGMAYCLEGFARLAVMQKQMEQAARLFSLSEKLYAPLRFEMSALERDSYDGAVTAIHAALGDKTFAAIWAEGKTMTLDQALEKL